MTPCPTCSQPTNACRCCGNVIPVGKQWYCDTCRLAMRRRSWRESKERQYAREKALAWMQIKALAS